LPVACGAFALAPDALALPCALLLPGRSPFAVFPFAMIFSRCSTTCCSFAESVPSATEGATMRSTEVFSDETSTRGE